MGVSIMVLSYKKMNAMLKAVELSRRGRFYFSYKMRNHLLY
jgi:hypothetical protein